MTPTTVVVRKHVSSTLLLVLSPSSSLPTVIAICLIIADVDAGWANCVVVICFFDAGSRPVDRKINRWVGAQDGFEPCFFVVNP